MVAKARHEAHGLVLAVRWRVSSAPCAAIGNRGLPRRRALIVRLSIAPCSSPPCGAWPLGQREPVEERRACDIDGGGLVVLDRQQIVGSVFEHQLAAGCPGVEPSRATRRPARSNSQGHGDGSRWFWSPPKRCQVELAGHSDRARDRLARTVSGLLAVDHDQVLLGADARGSFPEISRQDGVDPAGIEPLEHPGKGGLARRRKTTLRTGTDT